MRARKAFLLILLYLLSFYVYAQEEKKHYVIPAAEMLSESALLFCFNRYATPWKNYGHVDWSDIEHNLTSKWVWDQDEFNINQICPKVREATNGSLEGSAVANGAASRPSSMERTFESRS